MPGSLLYSYSVFVSFTLHQCFFALSASIGPAPNPQCIPASAKRSCQIKPVCRPARLLHPTRPEIEGAPRAPLPLLSFPPSFVLGYFVDFGYLSLALPLAFNFGFRLLTSFGFIYDLHRLDFFFYRLLLALCLPLHSVIRHSSLVPFSPPSPLLHHGRLTFVPNVCPRRHCAGLCAGISSRHPRRFTGFAIVGASARHGPVCRRRPSRRQQHQEDPSPGLCF